MAEVTALSRGGGGGRRSTWLRGSHCGGRETPPHAAAHPPSRGGLLRAAGSGEAALPGSDGERQCVPAPHARGCVFPPPAATAARQPRAAPERAQWRRRERVADPRRPLTRRRGPGLDVPAPAAGKDGGSGKTGDRTRGEGGRSGVEEEGGGGGDPGSAEPSEEGPRPAASDAETRAGAGRAPGGRGVRRRGRRALARGPRPREGGRRGRFPGLQRLAGLQAATHPSRPRDSPGAFSPRLDPAPPRALRRFPGRAFWELGPPARARSASRGVYLLTPGAHTHARSLAR